MNTIIISDLGEKDQSEIVKFWFDLTGDSAFVGSSAETIDEGATWYITTTTAPSTNIPSMVSASDYDNTAKQIAIQITGGVAGTSYYVKGRLIVASDRAYVVVGKFRVVDKGVTVI